MNFKNLYLGMAQEFLDSLKSNENLLNKKITVGSLLRARH